MPYGIFPIPQLQPAPRDRAGRPPGLALRVRTNGKGRHWDDALPKMMLAFQLLDALDQDKGGFGRNWQKAGEPPSVERKSVVPEDEGERIARHAQAVGAELESRETAVRELRPDWDDQQVADEVAAILREIGAPQIDTGDDEDDEDGE